MPKIVDKEEKKTRILEVAIRLFARLGLPNTKMMAIAEAAGIGKGTIFEYFKSKEDLFFAAFNAYVKGIEARIARRLRRIVDPVEKLRAYFTAWLDLCESELIEFADIMLDFWAEGLRSHKDRVEFDLSSMYQRYRAQIIQILDEGIQQKKFKPVDTIVTSSIIIGTLDGLMIQWFMDRDLYRIREAIEQLSNIIIDGLTFDQ